MCTIYINIETENDLYFAISNTILSLDNETFTEKDIINKLKENNISEEKIEIAKGKLNKCIELTIKNLVEHGKVIEEPRIYKLAK